MYGTGKSTCVSIANLIYNNSDAIIGTVENNPEEAFPLAPCYNKAVITALELDKDFALKPTQFNKMMSGEQIMVSIKHKGAQAVTWNSHFSAAGNQFWASESNNDQGQLSRRVLVFDFKRVITPDNTLDKRIRDHMLPIIFKGIRAYKALCIAAKSETTDAHTYIKNYTSYFEETLATLQTEKALRNFVLSELAVDKEEQMSVADFFTMFEEYCKRLQLGKQKVHDRNVADAFVSLETHHRKRHRDSRVEVWPKSKDGCKAGDGVAYYNHLRVKRRDEAPDLFRDHDEKKRRIEHMKEMDERLRRQQAAPSGSGREIDPLAFIESY